MRQARGDPRRAPSRRWNTIGGHLVGLVAIKLVFILGLVAFSAFQDFRDARREVSTQVETVAELAANSVVHALSQDRSTLDQVQMFPELFGDEAVCGALGQEAQEDWTASGLFRSTYSLVRQDGTSFCPVTSGDPAAKVVDTGQAWFEQASTTLDPVGAGPMLDPGSGTQRYVFAVQAPTAGTILVVQIDLSSAGRLLDAVYGKTRPKPSFVLTTSDRSSDLGGTGGLTSSEITDDSYIHAQAEASEFGWHVIAGVSTQDAFAASWQALRERTLFAGVVVLLILAAALVLSRRLARPVHALAGVTRRVSEGDLSARVVPAGSVELRELGEAYNDMIAVRRLAETTLRKAYRAESKAADELRVLDEMRQAFLRAISHEMRTPLTSVVGYSTFLDEAMDDLDADQVKKSITAIATQSKRLERLLLDLLDVERLERGIVEPSLIETDVTALVLRVVDQSSASDRVHADVRSSMKAQVDPALVERMLENLISNAVKHTPSDARIWVRARRVNGHLRLSVEDSGPGVPDELKTAIFEPFKQGDVPSHSPGTGVGLNLVAQFAKLHGGRAWVEDRRGGGAAFRIELPAGASPPKPKTATATAA